MNTLLVVSAIRSYMTIAIEERFKNLDYKVINEGTDITAINEIQSDITAILLYADADLLKNQQIMVYLKDKAVQDYIPVFVIGDSNEISELEGVFPRDVLKKCFARPIDVNNVASEIHDYVKLYGNQQKKKILVVDDSGAMLRNVKGWLEDRYQVILANSGAMAIKYLSTNRPDLVLLDYEMPVVNGKQVLEMIKTESDFSDIPVIFLTSKNDAKTITEVMLLKPEGYLLKTTKPEQIVKTIDDFFEKKKGNLK